MRSERVSSVSFEPKHSWQRSGKQAATERSFNGPTITETGFKFTKTRKRRQE
ncbi:unnamed protein product [Arctogadus glacialis]